MTVSQQLRKGLDGMLYGARRSPSEGPLSFSGGLVGAIAFGVLAASPALADDVAIDKYTVEITPAQIQVISAGLLELPGKTGLPVMQDLQAQLNKQIAEAKARAEEEAKAKK